MRSRRGTTAAISLVATALLVAACGSSSPGASSTTSAAAQGGSPPVSTAPASTTSTTVKSQVPAQSPFLAGTAHPHFAAGPAGQISVVYQAPISPQQNGTIVPIVLDNNTSKAVAHVDISGTAKDPTGKIVGSGNSQGTEPSVIQPGQWALAFIYFESAGGLAANDTMSFNVNTMPADTSPYNTAAVQVTQANLSGDSVTGGVQNTTGKPVAGPISVDLYCFDSSGHPDYEQSGFTSGNSDLAPGANDSFQISFYGPSCSSYLVGASGFYQ